MYACRDVLLELFIMSFPPNFPSIGVWKISYTDDYEEGRPVHTAKVFVTQYLGDYKLMRKKSKYGWKYKEGEMDKTIYELDDGRWSMYTYQSIIRIQSATRCNDDSYK